MKYILLLILSFSLVNVSCTSKRTTTESPTSKVCEVDSTYNRQTIDSLLSSLKWKNLNSHISYLGLNGHVKTVNYSIVGDGFYLPFETINFDEDGSLFSVFSGDHAYNKIIFDDPKDKIIRLGVEGAGLGMEFNMVRKDNKFIFTGYDEMGSAKFTFYYNSNNVISDLSIQYMFQPDMASNECEESEKSFKVKINSCDSLNNWTSLSFYSDGETTTVDRIIKYIDDPSVIALFDSNETILCKFPTEYNSSRLRLYNNITKQWHRLIPPPYSWDTFGYHDYRLIGDNLYLIYNTGNNFINAERGIYLYNIKNNTWEELALGAEGCEFVGDKIKVVSYEVIEDENDNVNDTGYEIIDDDNDDEEVWPPHYEYREVVEWIQMK